MAAARDQGGRAAWVSLDGIDGHPLPAALVVAETGLPGLRAEEPPKPGPPAVPNTACPPEVAHIRPYLPQIVSLSLAVKLTFVSK